MKSNQKKKTIFIKAFVILSFVLLIFPLKSKAASLDYCDDLDTLAQTFSEDTLRNLCSAFFSMGYTEFVGDQGPEGIYYNGVDCKNSRNLKLIRQTIVEVVNNPDYNLKEKCESSNISQELGLICKVCSDPNDPQTQQDLSNLVSDVDTTGTWAYSELGKLTQLELEEINQNCTVDANIGLIDFFKNPISWFFRLIFWIFARILEFIAYAFLYVLTPKNFGGFVNFPPVQTIWTIARNLANLGIILGFVFTAIATILKIEKYSWEKMLWRLVLVALLVNFSLVICGMFVDLSNFLITFFINGTNKQIIDFPTLLSYTAAKIACSGVGQGFWYEAATAVIGIIVAIVFIGQVIGLIIYAVTRIVTLWLTLGLSPLGFLSLAFPGAEKIANTWKNYFTQALISLPIIAFSFFIVLVMLNAVATSYFMPITTTEGKTFVQNVVAILAYGVIIIILSQATLVIAGAIGIQQVQKGYQWVNKIVWGALGFAGGAAVGATTKGLVSSESWRKTAESLEKSNLKLVHNLGTTMKDVSQKTREGELKNLAAKAEKMPEAEIRHEILIARKQKDRHKVGVLLDELAKRVKLTMADEETLAFAKDYVTVPLIKKAHPYLFTKYYSDPQDLRNKMDQIRQQQPNLSNEQIQKEAYNQLAIETAGSLSPDKLKEGNWNDISNYIKNTQGEAEQLEFLRKLTETVTPEAMAAIAQSIDPKKQYDFIQDLIRANSEAARTAGTTEQKYLLEIKGYKALRYFQGMIKEPPLT